MVFIRMRLDKVRNVLVLFRECVGVSSDKVGFYSEFVGLISEISFQVFVNKQVTFPLYLYTYTF